MHSALIVRWGHKWSQRNTKKWCLNNGAIPCSDHAQTNDNVATSYGWGKLLTATPRWAKPAITVPYTLIRICNCVRFFAVSIYRLRDPWKSPFGGHVGHYSRITHTAFCYPTWRRRQSDATWNLSTHKSLPWNVIATASSLTIWTQVTKQVTAFKSTQTWLISTLVNVLHTSQCTSITLNA